MDDVPDTLRWTWLNRLPRDEAEFRRFRRFFYAFPVMGLVVGAMLVLDAAVTWAWVGRLGTRDWIRGAGGVALLIGNALLLRRERRRVRFARDALDSA